MNVIFAVVLAALFAGPLLIHFWPAIEALSGGGAAFLGALVGAAAGLGAILTGALYNAKLNRDRDDRLREQEAKAIAVALRAEIIALMSDAETRLDFLQDFREAAAVLKIVDIARFDLPAKPMYANNTYRLGRLGDRVAFRVVEAHGTADHIRHKVAAMRVYPLTEAVDWAIESFRADFRRLIEDAAKAINALDSFLGDPERYPDPKALAAEADPTGPDTPKVPAN